MNMKEWAFNYQGVHATVSRSRISRKFMRKQNGGISEFNVLPKGFCKLKLEVVQECRQDRVGVEYTYNEE